MKESSRVTLVYSDLFKRNHPESYELAVKLNKEGKLELKNYKDYLKTREDILELFHRIDDLEDIVQRTKWKELLDEPLGVLIYLIKKDAESMLKSSIAIWTYHDRNYYTAISKDVQIILDKIESGDW